MDEVLSRGSVEFSRVSGGVVVNAAIEREKEIPEGIAEPETLNLPPAH
jgi:hypothetical protein